MVGNMHLQRWMSVAIIAWICISCVTAFELESEMESETEFQLDLSAPYFRFANVDAHALAEITYPTETTPDALQKILYPTPMMNSLEKIDLPGKEHTDEDAKILWEKHCHQYGKTYEGKENEARFAIFKANLVKVSEQNFLHGGGFSYKAAFADLTTKEFSKMKGLLFKPKDILKQEKKDSKHQAKEAREKAYADWLGFKNMFGDSRKNPFRTPYNETARGKAKVARYRKVKAAKAAAEKKKQEKAKAEAERLVKLGIKQKAMRDEKQAKLDELRAKAATTKAAKKAAEEKKKADIAKRQADLRKANEALKAAKKAKEAAKKLPKTSVPPVVKTVTPEPEVLWPFPIAPAKVAPKVIKKASAKAPVAAAPTTPKTLFELEAEVESDSLDSDQLEETALEADQLQAEVDALSDMDASTEITAESAADAHIESQAEAEMNQEVDVGVDEELIMLELDQELMAWSESESEHEVDEQQSIFARFESKDEPEIVEADVYTPPGETPVQDPIVAAAQVIKPIQVRTSQPLQPVTVLSAPVKNAISASVAGGTHNFEFPGETTMEIPNAPTSVKPNVTTTDAAAVVAPPVSSATPTVQPLTSTTTTDVTEVITTILSPGMDDTYAPTNAQRKAASNKKIIDIDWRTKGVMSPLKSQGQCGSCWAQSAITLVETAVAIRTNSTAVPLSVQQVVSCDTQDSGCDGGNPITGLAYLSNWAVSSASDYPYSDDMFIKGGPAPLCNATRSKNGFPLVESSKTYEKDEVAIAQALQKGPLAALVDASTWQFYDGSKIVYPASGCGSAVESLDHSVVIVGLGSLANGERYWIVRNHWDSTWGAGGYIFLAYGQNTCGISLQATLVTLSEKAFLEDPSLVTVEA